MRVRRRMHKAATATLLGLAVGLFAGVAAPKDQADVRGPRPRARDIGIPLEGEPGACDAITDVAGVEVGQVTVVREDVRTGATVILPRGRDGKEGVAAGFFAFNGTGEMTGTHFIKEFGAFFGPVVLTGTLGVGTARNGVLDWTRRTFDDPSVRFSRILPVVAETYDGGLSDVWRMPLTTEHVVKALEAARTGPVEEGSVGGGTGMVCFSFKCGIGTASRVVRFGADTPFTVGVLVQANHGRREDLVIAGRPVGREIPDLMPRRSGEPQAAGEGDGSLIVVIATDAPLLPSQLQRLAHRATMGMGRTGDYGTSLSGDIFLAFTTANPISLGSPVPLPMKSIPGEALDPIFSAVAQATEEAILNALVAGEDTAGRGGAFIYGLPHERVRRILNATSDH
jgi:L-aminopeptidase/D-esterase-like protein